MSEPDEIEKLRNTIHVLEQALSDANARAYLAEHQLRSLGLPEHIYGSRAKALRDHELMYWIGKCQRQRRAINHIQRRGWYPPEYVIHEEETPWDLADTA